MQYILEICIDSFESAKAAIDGGADRLEICSALDSAGLTPSLGLFMNIQTYCNNISKKVDLLPMIRPRPGDFIYNSDDINIMKYEIEVFKSKGCNGFVFGLLNQANNKVAIDTENCKTLLKACDNLPATFHRAFDLCSDNLKEASNLKELGFARLLTSGQRKTAFEGVELIKQLNHLFGHFIKIIPGSGISKSNIAEIRKITGCTEYHTSASELYVSSMYNISEKIFSKGVSQWMITKKDIVTELKSILNP